jgi:hypothetical protein
VSKGWASVCGSKRCISAGALAKPRARAVERSSGIVSGVDSAAPQAK